MRTAYDLLSFARLPIRKHLGSNRRYSRFAHAVLQFLAEHRTALAAHVQRQFPDLFLTDRAVRMHLQTLVASGELELRQSPSLGNANVYLARPAMGEPRRTRPSGSHLLHELLITEFAVSLAEAVRQRPDLALPWEERFGFDREGAFRSLVPDYAFLLQHAQGLLACFVEVFSGEDSPMRIGQKLAKYAAWVSEPQVASFLIDLQARHGVRTAGPHFRLLLVIHERRTGHDHTRLRQILRETLTLSRAMRQRIWLAAVTELAADKSVDAPIWYRARDVDSLVSHWDQLAQIERRAVLRYTFSRLPRHRLFPSPETSNNRQ